MIFSKIQVQFRIRRVKDPVPAKSFGFLRIRIHSTVADYAQNIREKTTSDLFPDDSLEEGTLLSS
jgi:hypothetical protein